MTPPSAKVRLTIMYNYIYTLYYYCITITTIVITTIVITTIAYCTCLSGCVCCFYHWWVEPCCHGYYDHVLFCTGRTQSKGSVLSAAPPSLPLAAHNSPEFTPDTSIDENIKKITNIPTADSSFAQFKKQALERVKTILITHFHLFVS